MGVCSHDFCHGLKPDGGKGKWFGRRWAFSADNLEHSGGEIGRNVNVVSGLEFLKLEYEPLGGFVRDAEESTAGRFFVNKDNASP